MKRVFGVMLSVIVASLMSLATPTVTYALSDTDLNYFSQNNILFYDPGASRRGCYSGNLSGDTVMAKIVSYLKGNNPSGFVLSDNGIAGILANIQWESGFNPFRFQGDKITGPAYGIAQFDPMSKILEPLKTDPRTANYFNEYFNLKYTYFDSATGYPKEKVPDDVLDAWLSVQLDYFFGPSSEFENTKVGSYRNMGGTMGLDYIPSSLTAHEALEAARTPEDATRIFVWIMERPGDKSGDASKRSAYAQQWLAFAQNIGTADGSGNSTNVIDGGNVTIIGDSITVGSESAIKALLPNADIYAQVSKQFYTGTTDNPGGITILKELADSDKLRDVVVYALGTNSSITSNQAKEVVDIAGSSRKVVFVTNYTTSDDYDANNNVFAKIKNSYASRVMIVDWKTAVASQPDEYLSEDGIHPNAAGQQLFASLIASTVGASESTVSVCSEVAVNGGLTDAQAQALADYYNSGEVRESDWGGMTYSKRNCVAFSAFFVQRFTSVGASWRTWGNGRDVAANLARAEGLMSGTVARPFAVFSVTKGRAACGNDLCGHTGIVVRVDNDEITTIEASYSPNGGSGAIVYSHDISWFINSVYGDTFTYLDDILNAGQLTEVVGGA